MKIKLGSYWLMPFTPSLEEDYPMLTKDPDKAWDVEPEVAQALLEELSPCQTFFKV